MAADKVVQTVLEISAGEVLLISAGIGWLLRRSAARLDKLIATVGELVTHAEVSKVTGPELTRRMVDVEDVTEETRVRVAVLADWREGHERWHALNPPR